MGDGVIQYLDGLWQIYIPLMLYVVCRQELYFSGTRADVKVIIKFMLFISSMVMTSIYFTVRVLFGLIH